MSGLLPSRVRVPCSTSNLGSGYDTVGLALDRYLDVWFDPDDSGRLDVVREGSLAGIAVDEPDLAASVFKARLEREGAVASGRLRLRSEIPVARGLGSSAAARLAGYDLAEAALGRERNDDGAFESTLRLEGHADNIAPCLFGGLRAVAQTPDGPVVLGIELSDRVGFAYAAPAGRISTDEARGLLPRQVPHKVAAASLGRVIALVRGLAEANPDLVRIGVTDELHTPHRLPLIPSVMAAISAGVDAGAWAVTISGAGSGLIGLCDPDDADAVAAAMHEVFDAGTGDPECVGFAVRPDFTGLRRVPNG